MTVTCVKCGKAHPGAVLSVAALSDDDVMMQLDQVLRATVPAYLRIRATNRETGKVVYVAAPDSVERLFERSFVVDGNAVTLRDDVREVRETHTFEPVHAARATMHAEQVPLDAANADVDALVNAGRRSTGRAPLRTAIVSDRRAMPRELAAPDGGYPLAEDVAAGTSRHAAAGDDWTVPAAPDLEARIKATAAHRGGAW